MSEAMTPEELEWAFANAPVTSQPAPDEHAEAEAAAAIDQQRRQLRERQRRLQQRLDADMRAAERQQRELTREQERRLAALYRRHQSDLERIRFRAAMRQVQGLGQEPTTSDFFSARKGFFVGFAVGAFLMGAIWATSRLGEE